MDNVIEFKTKEAKAATEAPAQTTEAKPAVDPALWDKGLALYLMGLGMKTAHERGAKLVLNGVTDRMNLGIQMMATYDYGAMLQIVTDSESIEQAFVGKQDLHELLKGNNR